MARTDGGCIIMGMEASIAFNVQFFPSGDVGRLYRVYLTPAEAYFLLLDRLEIGWTGLATHVFAGPAAPFILLLRHRWAERQRAKKIRSWEDVALESVLPLDPSQFRVTPEDVIESSIEPPSWFQAAIGLWEVHFKQHDKMRLVFCKPEDLHVALTVLPAWSNGIIRVNGKWRESIRRLVRKRGE